MFMHQLTTGTHQLVRMPETAERQGCKIRSQANQRSRTERSIWKTSFLRNNEAVNSPSSGWFYTWDPSGTCTHGCHLGALIDSWGIESIYFPLCTSASWVPDKLTCFQFICRESNLFAKKLQVLQNLCNFKDRQICDVALLIHRELCLYCCICSQFLRKGCCCLGCWQAKDSLCLSKNRIPSRKLATENVLFTIIYRWFT